MKCHAEICMKWKADINELFLVCFLVRFVLAQQCNSLGYERTKHFEMQATFTRYLPILFLFKAAPALPKSTYSSGNSFFRLHL